MSNKGRYPGPKPFTAEQAHLFYGRKQEAHRLRRLIEDKQLTVLYGRSGYGKSSLLNAAVLPAFATSGYHLINVRMGAWTPDSKNTPLRSTVRAISNESADLDKTVLDELVQWDNSLWYYVKTFAINAHKPKVMFVFDQFEELFTYPLPQIESYENSLSELLRTGLPQRYRDALKKNKALTDHPQYDAVFESMEIKIVVAIRSNRFHLLERLSPALPDILQNTFELDALEREGARSAIVEPAAAEGKEYATPTFSYSRGVQDEILDFLTQDGRIEGILLQMLCSHFERIVQRDPTHREITEADLLVAGNDGDVNGSGMEGIVDIYYRDRIDDLPDEQEETVKRFIEDNLVQKVGNGGMRLSMHQAQIKERFGIEADTLDALVRNGLLRTEPFLRGGVTYELTHDRLINPVLKSKAVFDAGEADRLKEQLEAEARKRREAEALQARAEAAQVEAEAERTRALSAEEAALEARTDAEEERRKALEAKHRAETSARRAKVFSWVSGLLMLVAAVTGLNALKNLREAESERAQKNLILCKEYLIDARSLARFNYCVSALDKLRRADTLIGLYGDQGEAAVRAAYAQERETLRAIKSLLDNKQKQESCR